MGQANGQRNWLQGSFRRWGPPLVLVAAMFGLHQAGVSPSSLLEGLNADSDGAPIVFVVAGVVLMSLLIPKTAVSLCAGVLFGTILGSVLMLVIALLAAALNYWMGFQWRLWAFSKHHTIDESLKPGRVRRLAFALRDWAETAGTGVHSLVRVSPLPCWLISYSMGMARARFWPYLAGAAVGVLPQCLYVHAGASMQSGSGTESDRWLASGLSLVLALCVTAILGRIGATRVNEMLGASRRAPLVSPSR